MIGSLPVLKIIYESGGNITTPNSIGWLPIHYALKYHHANCVQYLIGLDAFRTEEDDTILTLLNLAISLGDTKTAKFLLSRCSDVRDNNNWDVSFFTAAANNLELFDMVTSEEDYGKADRNGRTFFHVLTMNGNYEFLSILASRAPHLVKQKDKFVPFEFMGKRLSITQLSFSLEISAS